MTSNPDKITEIWAWVCTEPGGNEGVPAFKSSNGWLPMMGADEERVRALEPAAQEVCDQGMPVKLMRFQKGVLVGVLVPTPKERDYPMRFRGDIIALWEEGMPRKVEDYAWAIIHFYELAHGEGMRDEQNLYKTKYHDANQQDFNAAGRAAYEGSLDHIPLNTEAQNDMPMDAATTNAAVLMDEDRDLIRKWAERIYETATELRQDNVDPKRAANICDDARRILAMVKALG